MTKEVWKIWKDTRYNSQGALWEVSNQGNVKKNGKLFECRLDKGGYKVFGPGWVSIELLLYYSFLIQRINHV